MCKEITPKSLKAPDSEKRAMKELANHVYSDLKKTCNKTGWMNGRAIPAPTNKQVNEINNMITDFFPGQPYILTSSDELVNPDDLARFNIEYLNSRSFRVASSSPFHKASNAPYANEEPESQNGSLQWNQTHFQQSSQKSSTGVQHCWRGVP